MSAVFELFANSRAVLGESAVWCEWDCSLYWLDVLNGIVYRKKGMSGDPESFDRFELKIGKIGGISFTREKTILLFAEAGKVWEWTPGAEPVIYTNLRIASETRFNEVITAPDGTVFCTVAPLLQGGIGSLWRMDLLGKFSCIEVATTGMPNGLGFSPDRRKLYFTVTTERRIYSYDFEPDRGGHVSNKDVFVQMHTGEGRPDGLTVDSEGCVWSALWEGGKLVRFSPDGAKVAEYAFPMRQVTGVAFGGEGLRDLFVSTANYPWDDGEFEMHHAGAVFRMKESPYTGKLEFLR